MDRHLSPENWRSIWQNFINGTVRFFSVPFCQIFYKHRASKLLIQVCFSSKVDVQSNLFKIAFVLQFAIFVNIATEYSRCFLPFNFPLNSVRSNDTKKYENLSRERLRKIKNQILVREIPTCEARSVCDNAEPSLLTSPRDARDREDRLKIDTSERKRSNSQLVSRAESTKYFTRCRERRYLRDCAYV